MCIYLLDMLGFQLSCPSDQSSIKRVVNVMQHFTFWLHTIRLTFCPSKSIKECLYCIHFINCSEALTPTIANGSSHASFSSFQLLLLQNHLFPVHCVDFNVITDLIIKWQVAK